MGQINLKTKIKINPKIIYKQLEGKIYILQPDREEIHELNETASFIWILLTKKNDISTIIKKMTNEFDVSLKQAESDIVEFIDKYLRENFISYN